MSPSANTQYVSSENISISTEGCTSIAPYTPFATKYVFDTKIQALFDILYKVQKKIDKNYDFFDKQHK